MSTDKSKGLWSLNPKEREELMAEAAKAGVGPAMPDMDEHDPLLAAYNDGDGNQTGQPELPTELPWEISHEYGDGFNIAHEIAPSCGKLAVIANVQYSNVAYQPTRDEAKANARLIVASVNQAEALAEALRAVDKAYQEMFDVMPVAFQTYAHIVEEALANWEGAK